MLTRDKAVAAAGAAPPQNANLPSTGPLQVRPVIPAKASLNKILQLLLLGQSKYHSGVMTSGSSAMDTTTTRG